MRLTSWNLLHGMAAPPTQPPTPQNQLSALLSLSIEKINPDLLGLQEVDYFLERSGNENQVASIATSIGADFWAFAPSIIGSPDEKWRRVSREDARIISNTEPNSETNTEANGGREGESAYGIGLISKIPVTSWHRLELQPSPIGILMLLPVNGKLKRLYVRDHPRSAIAAVLENGWLIVNTHLSFVPIFNFLQLLKIKRWVKALPIKDKKKILIMGDLNLPWLSFARGINWNSLARQKTFPSWKPKLQLDYILSQKVASEDVGHIPSVHQGISDHLPLTVDIDIEF